mgnify:CR=1 FL=1
MEVAMHQFGFFSRYQNHMKAPQDPLPQAAYLNERMLLYMECRFHLTRHSFGRCQFLPVMLLNRTKKKRRVGPAISGC